MNRAWRISIDKWFARIWVVGVEWIVTPLRQHHAFLREVADKKHSSDIYEKKNYETIERFKIFNINFN